MHKPCVLTDSRGRQFRITEHGYELIPQPFHYRWFHWLITLAYRLG